MIAYRCVGEQEAASALVLPLETVSRCLLSLTQAFERLTHMEIKDTLPLVGVALGWFLKEFADAFRHRGEKHARIGKVLVSLFQLHDELRRLKMHQAFMKDRPDSWTEYERFRIRAARRYLDGRGNLQGTIQEAVDLVASRWPFDAVDLGHIKVILTWYYSVDLGALLSDQDKYIKALSSMEVAFEIAERLLRRLVLKLARMHSSITWVRVRWNWRKHESALERRNREFTEQLLSDFYTKTKTDAEAEAAQVEPLRPANNG